MTLDLARRRRTPRLLYVVRDEHLAFQLRAEIERITAEREARRERLHDHLRAGVRFGLLLVIAVAAAWQAGLFLARIWWGR